MYEAIEGTAKATPVKKQTLYFLVGGRIQSIEVEPEDEVSEGTLLAKLETIYERIQQWIKESLPLGLLFAQEILEIQDEDQAIALLTESSDKIDEEFLGSLIATAERFEEDEAEGDAQRVRKLYREGIRLSMREKMKASNSEE